MFSLRIQRSRKFVDLAVKSIINQPLQIMKPKPILLPSIRHMRSMVTIEQAKMMPRHYNEVTMDDECRFKLQILITPNLFSYIVFSYPDAE